MLSLNRAHRHHVSAGRCMEASATFSHTRLHTLPIEKRRQPHEKKPVYIRSHATCTADRFRARRYRHMRHGRRKQAIGNDELKARHDCHLFGQDHSGCRSVLLGAWHTASARKMGKPIATRWTNLHPSWARVDAPRLIAGKPQACLLEIRRACAGKLRAPGAMGSAVILRPCNAP